MKTKNIFKSIALVPVLFGSFTMKSFALPADPWSFIDSLTSTKSGDENTLLDWAFTVFNWVIGMAAVAAVVFLVYNGFLYISAGGDEGKVEKATKGITNAIIGLVICIISTLIIRFVMGSILEV